MQFTMTNAKEDRTHRPKKKKGSNLNSSYNRKEIVHVSNLKAILTLPPNFPPRNRKTNKPEQCTISCGQPFESKDLNH